MEENGKVIRVINPPDCDCLFEKEFAVLVKYSLSCPFSLYKFEEIVQFYSAYREIPLYALAVQTARAASALVESCTGIRHETPQILAMRRGVVVAHGSRSRITEKFLVETLRMKFEAKREKVGGEIHE